jgi:hypothetical protein
MNNPKRPSIFGADRVRHSVASASALSLSSSRGGGANAPVSYETWKRGVSARRVDWGFRPARAALELPLMQKLHLLAML